MARTLIINGVDFIPFLQSCVITTRDLDGDSFRNAEGNLTRDRIAVKRTISMTFNPLNSSELATILTAVSGVSFPVTFTNPETNNTVNSTFYSGDRPATNLLDDMYKDVKFDVVEV